MGEFEQTVLWTYLKSVLELSLKAIPLNLKLNIEKTDLDRYRISSLKEPFFFIADLNFDRISNKARIILNVNNYYQVNERLAVDYTGTITSDFTLENAIMEKYEVMENETYLDYLGNVLDSHSRIIRGSKEFNQGASSIFVPLEDVPYVLDSKNNLTKQI